MYFKCAYSVCPKKKQSQEEEHKKRGEAVSGPSSSFSPSCLALRLLVLHREVSSSSGSACFFFLFCLHFHSFCSSSSSPLFNILLHFCPSCGRRNGREREKKKVYAAHSLEREKMEEGKKEVRRPGASLLYNPLWIKRLPLEDMKMK